MSVFPFDKCIYRDQIYFPFLLCVQKFFVLQPREAVVRGGSCVLGSFNGMLNFVFVLFFLSERDLVRHRASEKQPPTWWRSSVTPIWITGKEAKNCNAGTMSCLEGWEKDEFYLILYIHSKEESVEVLGGKKGCCRENLSIQKEGTCLCTLSMKCFLHWCLSNPDLLFLLHRTRVYDLIQLAQNQIPC